jgi:hypothetical protein
VQVTPDISDWYELKLLDQVDLTRDPAAEATRLKAQLPSLEADLAAATKWVADALAPVPANHPSDDTWDEHVFFLRAMNESRYGPKAASLARSREQLAALAASDDPGRKVAGWVLGAAHDHVKALGLGSGQESARRLSRPAAVGGLALAEIVWQARNQDQHHNDGQDLSRPVVTCFQALVGHDPGLFRLSSAPPDVPSLQALLRQRSWAPEVLRLMGWTSAASTAAAISSMQP